MKKNIRYYFLAWAVFLIVLYGCQKTVVIIGEGDHEVEAPSPIHIDK